MPLELQRISNSELTRYNNCNRALFESKEDMHKSLSRFCNGNLYIIGSLWVQVVKKVLVGHKMCLIPTVQAAKPPPEPPKRPPKMKYTELPLHQTPEHVIYQEHLEEEFNKGCPGKNSKILQKKLEPCVSKFRATVQDMVNDKVDLVKGAYGSISNTIIKKKNEVKAYARDPNKLCYRRLAVLFGTTAGYLLGSPKKGYLYRRFFWAGIGALSTGWLCFPDETDEYFREACYEAAKLFLSAYNFYCNKHSMLGGIGPCEYEKPPLPPPEKKQKDPCDGKK